jgi:Domain of unknown function (DUF4365)
MATDSAPRPSSHALGDFGERMVTYLLPSEWVIHNYKGSEDYGIDLHIEIFSDGRPTGLEFGIQVKSVERFHPKKCPKAKLTINNIAYISSKAFPTMIAVASKKDKSVRFSWLGDLMDLDELMDILRPNQNRKSILLRLDPNHELSDDVTDIVQHVSLVKSRIGFWYQEEAHRRIMDGLYFDVHAALDALIEIGCKPRFQKFSSDEWSHKVTYTFSLVSAVYFLLHSLTRNRPADASDPTLRAITAIISRLRELILTIIPEEYVELHEAGKDMSDIVVVPGSPTKLLEQSDQFICAFRDMLRELAGFRSSSRDSSMRLSAMAAMVIDFEATEEP